VELAELYLLVKRFYGYKSKMLYGNTETLEAACVLYDSFLFKCNINDRYGRFGAGIVLGETYITDFLGEKCSLNSDEKSIRQSLQIVDDYCRLRLPDKFLQAYDEAYKE
jgi:hypothetical protein